MIEKEKQVQHKKLERELEIFRLFDLGWSIEEVDFKLRLGRREISKYFNEWAEMRIAVKDQKLHPCHSK